MLLWTIITSEEILMVHTGRNEISSLTEDQNEWYKRYPVKERYIFGMSPNW